MYAEGLQRFAYVSTISGGPTTPPDDYGIVAVIDGSKSYTSGQKSSLMFCRFSESHTDASGQCTTTNGIARTYS